MAGRSYQRSQEEIGSSGVADPEFGAEQAKAEGEETKKEGEKKTKKDKDMAAPADAEIPVQDRECSVITMEEMKMLKLQGLAKEAAKQGLVHFLRLQSLQIFKRRLHQLQLQSPQAHSSYGEVPGEV